MQEPLAERMRPKTVEEYIGQEHLTGPGKILRNALESQQIPSMILWGPPGVGKTTLAQIIANTVKVPFYNLSAIHSGVKDVRETIDKAKNAKFFNPNGRPILFIDEIHRFSKSQQDSLLGAVEKGYVTLVGATTENPGFEVINALLSRCQVFVLQALQEEHLKHILNQAAEKDVYLSKKEINIIEYDNLIQFSGGDARKILNALEIIVQHLDAGGKTITITNSNVLEVLQNNIAQYDKNGELHYDIISAFIKSLRGSDPNAALFWMAKMLLGGEDPLFIARRMVILAAEDIGLANPNALLMANATFQSVQQIGMPESRIILSECAIYLATSPKSNSAYSAIGNAYLAAEQNSNAAVPLHLRNAANKLMKNLDYGKNYAYAHAHTNNFVNQEFMPQEMEGKTIYFPGNNPKEKEIKTLLHKLWSGKYTADLGDE